MSVKSSHNALDALSEENLQRLFDDIESQLPKKEDQSQTEWIISEIERQLWRTVAGDNAVSKDSVTYTELQVPESFIGYVKTQEEENDTKFLPWWFQSFNWKFQMPTNTVNIPDGSEDLEQLRDFDPTETQVHRPKYKTDNDRRCIKTLLNALNGLKNELSDSTDIRQTSKTYGPDEKHPELPSDIFKISADYPVIETSDEFTQWLRSILELCPPYNETTTALTWYNLGLPRDVGKDLLGEDDVETLEQAGISRQDRIMNRKYRKATHRIMAFKGVFDVTVGINTSTELSLEEGLETAYIEAWLNNANRSDYTESRIMDLAAKSGSIGDDKGDEWEYAPYCIELPVSYDGKRNSYHLTFDTQYRKRGKYGACIHDKYEQRDRAERICNVVKQTSYFAEPDQ